MFWIMVFIILLFIGLVIYIAKAVVMQLEHRAEEDVLRAKDSYQQIIDQKDKAASEKIRLEKEVSRIFNLYELTRDVAKCFDRNEAFDVFKQKLAQIVSYDECLLLESHERRIEEYQTSHAYNLFQLKDKEIVHGYIAFKGVRDEDINTFHVLAHQFVLALRRIRLYDQIERMATTDSLTGVFTRRHFSERFEEEIQRSKLYKMNLALLMLDADHFKNINDRYGHLTGDQVLREIAVLIKENIREIDIAGRYGGEEFCVVLPDTPIEAALMVAERIRKAVESAKIHVYDAEVKISVSIGIASFPNDGAHVDELIDKADWALYRAKKQGRNMVCAFGIYEEENS